MKQILLTIIFCIAFINLTLAQTPHSFKYQAVVRNNQGQIVQNQLVSLRVSILSGSATGNSVYTETHQKATSEFGIVNLNVGGGTLVSGSFNNIDWSGNSYFVKIELDLTGGGNYTFISTSQLLSVPYALYAEKTAGSENDHDTSSSNEIQAISLTNDTLYLSNGGKVFLGAYMDDTDTDNQTLSMPNPTTLSISNGNSVTLSAGMADLDADPTNELQYLFYSNDTIYLSQGNYVVLPHDADLDSLNEIQVMSKAGNQISLSKNGGIVTDDDNQNLSSTITGTQRTINISGGSGTIIDVADNDNSITNELQNLSYSNDTLSISNGNSVSITDYSFRTLNLPQGICGHIDTIQCYNQLRTYQIPNNKNFYFYNFGQSTNIYYPDVNRTLYSYNGQVIIGPGNNLVWNCTGSSSTLSFAFFLKDSDPNIQPVFIHLVQNSITYTVPLGKKYIITAFKTYDVNTHVDSDLIYFIDGSTNLYQNIVPTNTIIRASSGANNGEAWIFGYLLNE